MSVITAGLIAMGMSQNGAWNQQQLAILGVPWPPQKGWKRRVIGTVIDSARADQFLALKDAHIKPQQGGAVP